jgi:hypothetical protein
MTNYVLAAALVAAFSGTVSAQTTGSAATTAPNSSGTPESHWITGAFVASAFHGSSDTGALENSEGLFGFGLQGGYLWRGMVGGELLLDIAPHVNLGAAAERAFEHIGIGTYMANAIGTYPLGTDGQFQPYASGGFGRVDVGGDLFSVPGDPTSDTSHIQHGRWGQNIGGGLMAFASKNVGLRTDVRWYHVGDSNGDADKPFETNLSDQLLEGLEYWRFNIGMALRF